LAEILALVCELAGGMPERRSATQRTGSCSRCSRARIPVARFVGSTAVDDLQIGK